MIVLFALLSGVLGRMGGAGKSGQWYDFLLDTKWRDAGCSALLIGTWCYYFGWHSDVWWAYLVAFALSWAAFSTYFDTLFGYDNFGFSGFMVGCAGIPLIFTDISLWWIVLCRIIILTVAWGMLHKYLPARVWVWRRDVFEENARYALSL